MLHDENLQHHRSRAWPAVARPHEHVATGAWQVASWDISYLHSFVRGQFFYLYLVVDVWSWKILGWDMHADESSSSPHRPSVSDDNPFSEALFRTLKYCPEYPTAGFASVEDARAWVGSFVD